MERIPDANSSTMKLNRRFLFASLVCSLGFAAPLRADDKEPAADKKTEEKAETKKEGDAKTEMIEVGDFTFKFGAPWKKGTPSNNMSAAGLTHGEGKEAITADFYYFGTGQGGDTQANVARWISQFEGEPEVETEKVEHDGTKVTYVYATGTFLSGPAFGEKTPMDDYALYGAIIEGKSAPVFIKMTGPIKGMEAARESYKKLAASPFAK